MEYSAGMVSCLFWFNETLNTIPYYLDNTPVCEMRKIAVEQNLYQVRAQDRCKRIAGVVYKRLDTLTPELIAELRDSDINTAHIIHLISIMKSDLLFFEFMNLCFKKTAYKFIINFLIALFYTPKERELSITIATDRATMVNDILYRLKRVHDFQILERSTRQRIGYIPSIATY